jgi:hypothetical protein
VGSVVDEPATSVGTLAPPSTVCGGAMSKFGSQEWLERYRELGAVLPATAGVTAVVEHVVPGSPDGELRYVVTIVGGQVTGASRGGSEGVDVSLTTKYPDAVEILTGGLDVNAAFISGRMKVTGSTGTLLGLLALYGSGSYGAFRAELAASTEM